MDINFYKLHTAGNDILLINRINEGSIDEKILPHLASQMCKRKLGIGANGAVFINFDDKENIIKTKFFNAKGREPKYYNDGLFSVGRFLFDSGRFKNNSLVISTVQGEREIKSIDSNNFQISLPQPKTISNEKIHFNPENDYTTNTIIENQNYNFTALNIEKNFAVFFQETLSIKKKKNMAKVFSRRETTGKKFVTIFSKVFGDDTVAVEYFKPLAGADLTMLSCGAVAASTLNGFLNSEGVSLINDHEIFINWNQKTNSIFATAKPEYIFSGSYYFNEDLYLS